MQRYRSRGWHLLLEQGYLLLLIVPRLLLVEGGLGEITVSTDKCCDRQQWKWEGVEKELTRADG